MLEVDKSNAKVEILTANEEGQYVDDEGQVIFGSDGTPLKAVTPTYTETTVVDLYDTEKYPNAVAYSGNTVNVYGLLTYEKYRGESNTNFYLVDVESGKRLAIYYKSYTDEQKKVLETFAGKYVTIDAIAHDFYTSAPGPFRRLLVNADSVKEAAAPVLTDQQQADYIIGTLFLSESYGVDFTLPTEATWEVVSGTGIEIVDGVAKVTKAETEQTVVLKATVKVNDEVATKEFTVVVERLNQAAMTVAEVLALVDDASVKVVAKVVAIYARGYIVADNTGNVLVYFGSSFSQDFNIGDVVLVEGTKGTFNKGVQIASPTVTASTETVELTETAPKELTAADLDAYASSTTVTVELVKLTGKLTISNNKYYNVAIDGTSKQGSISFPLTGLVDSNLNGKKVVVTGYVFSVSGTNYINIMALSVAEVELTDAEKVAEALAKVSAPATATEDFTLVEVEGVVWSLKAESVAATLAGNTVKVTRQSADTEIVLVATATFGEVTDSKEFTVTVLAEGTAVTEKTLTIDFSTATGTGTKVSDPTTFVNTYASVNILKSATATNVYDGNGAGGKWENTKGLVKMGTSKKNGVLTLTFNEGVKKIGRYAFYNTALKAAVLPASVVSIGNYAFGYVESFDTNTADPFVMGGKSVEAANYAAINGIAYYDMTKGCPHAYVVTTVPATVFAKGKKISTCPLCGNTITKSIKKKTFKISSLKAAKKALTVKAAAQAEMKGYQVQYSTSKKFTKKTTKTVKVATKKKLNKKIKGLKSGKKYYVRVRAYKMNGKKTVYSAWTAKKSVKVK